MSYETLSSASPEAQSASSVQENLAALMALFPSVVRDGMVDADALRQLVGEALVKEGELYGLNWRGKTEARRKALKPTLGTLRPIREESVHWDTTGNLYLEGDNLEVLKLLRKAYGGKVKMIYIDPPYNTGKDFIYPDDYHHSMENYKQITGQNYVFAANLESGGRFHTVWLNMMLPRMMLARDMLTEDGMVFISLDDHEIGNMRLLCDEVFGERNFVAQICHRARGSVSNDKIISSNHNIILFYAKNQECLFEQRSRIGLDPILEGFSEDDGDGKGPYKLVPVDGPGGAKKGNPFYTFMGVTGFFRFSEETMKRMHNDGIIVRRANSLYQKYYLSAAAQSRRTDVSWWDDAGLTSSATAALRKMMGAAVFDNPKPVSLLLRMLQLATHDDANALVMDFFSGSSTTAHAVMEYNAARGGNRRFIMVQLPEPTPEGSEAAAAGFATICDVAKARLRRAGADIVANMPEGAAVPDVGFRVYRLDSSNVRAWNPQPANLAEAVAAYGDHLLQDRTKEDFLAEMMLKSGIELTEKTETRLIADCEVHCMANGLYFACMEADLAEAGEAVAKGIAAWAAELAEGSGAEHKNNVTVFVLDAAFQAYDAAKLNFVSCLQQHGISHVKAL